MGQALEVVVQAELARRGAELGYVRTPGGFEVDFLARFADGRQELIQVCADPAHAATGARELRALEDAAREYPHATRRLLVLEQSAKQLAAPEGVQVQTVYEWLLMQPISH